LRRADGGADARVGGAAADVSGHRAIDVAVSSGCLGAEERGALITWPDWQCRLRHVLRDPGVLHRLAGLRAPIASIVVMRFPATAEAA